MTATDDIEGFSIATPQAIVDFCTFDVSNSRSEKAVWTSLSVLKSLMIYPPVTPEAAGSSPVTHAISL